MGTHLHRRDLLKLLAVAPALIPTHVLEQKGGRRFKTSLNAYSFNEPLRAGTMTLDDLLDYCARQDFDAVDITGYYFPNYPHVPPDEYLFQFKRKAHRLGLSLSGTGIRTDFTQPDAGKRKEDIQLVKNWVHCAAKLGAPVLRIFAGHLNPPGYSWEQIATWMVPDLRECVEYGQKHGVIVAVQNHNDFLKTADQVIDLIKRVDREWLGLVLDVGSYQHGDPYRQIEQTLPYAVNWQVKELVTVNGKEERLDLGKLVRILNASGYRGFLPIETLGKGDPKEKVARFLDEVRNALG
ncbi:MAG: sugar phosphate isomerase/epimerase [Sphingobacteriaceae bacterium]|nr:sugar phosphate isomerase/epimerase [Cytophagaceae bacterium]